MLTICSYKWGDKYGPEYVARLVNGLHRHLEQPFRFILVSDRDCAIDGVERVSISDIELTKVKGCFARLRLFDPDWQNGLGLDDVIVCVDLDTVTTGPLDATFSRPEPFVILQGANASNPCPYNGSIWMLRASYRPDVWSDFSLDKVAAIPHDAFPDDQAWFAHKLPGAAGWKAGAQSGIYAFMKPGWPGGTDLPKDARLVSFPGWRDPKKFSHLPWVKDHWR